MLVEQKGGMRQATVSSLDTEGDTPALEVQIRLAGGIGVSVINSVPEELVFINLEQIEVSKSRLALPVCILKKKVLKEVPTNALAQLGKAFSRL